MKVGDEIFFPPFRLDLVNERLFRGERQLQIRPKNFAVLRHLIEHAGQVVRKEDLVKRIWGTYESEGALKQSIFQLREQLEDDAEEPRFIETVPRGYRFIAEVKRWQPQAIPLPPNFVGRTTELEQLRRWAERAKRGERQIVFITGEPGIGKTTLIDAIVAQLAADPTVWIGRGQCIEQYGEGEPYLPILEALGRIGRRAGAEQFSAFLGRYAPTWLAQLPSLIDEEKQEALQRRVQGATKLRMLRELVEAVEIFTAEAIDGAQPFLVLVLEDLQWSDYSTLDLLSSLARRREPARLLILGTYRPAEGLVEGHPLRAITQELRGHGQCEELTLELLNAEAVETYIEKRFPSSAFPSRFAEVLYRLTNGNPLFLVTIIDDFVRQSILAEVNGHWVLQNTLEAIAASVPDNIRQLVNRQIDRLAKKEQRILEAASIAGLEFSIAAVAAAIETEIIELEICCDALVRRNQFLQLAGRSEWPDGTVSSRYSFRHALYQYLWQDRVSLNERQRFHRRIGVRLEAAYGNHASEVAAELALHFEEGHDYQRAVYYLQRAAENAARRNAHQEAILHLTKGLELFKTLPDEPERPRQELSLLTSLSVPLMVTRGYADTEVGTIFTKARQLCERMGEEPELLPVLWGLCSFYTVRGECRTGWKVTESLLRLAENLNNPTLLMMAHLARGGTSVWVGRFTEAKEHLEKSIVFYNSQHDHSLPTPLGYDPGIACLSYASLALWGAGYPDQALSRVREALQRAQELNHPYTSVHTQAWAAVFYQHCNNVSETFIQAEAIIKLSTEFDFPLWLAMGTVLRGWGLVQQESIDEGLTGIRQGIEAYQATGAGWGQSYYPVLLAEAYGKAQRPEEGLKVLATTMPPHVNLEERWWEAEKYRLKGELLLQASGHSSSMRIYRQATECFEQARTLAQIQRAKMLELRAALSLSKALSKQQNRQEAQQILSEVYEWFTEGQETKEIQEARSLLMSFTQ